MAHFNSVSALAISTVFSASLILGGCGEKDNSKAVDAIVKVETRKVPEAEAQQALSALSLSESGSGVLTWADRSGSAGNYTFTDLTLKHGEQDTVTNVGKVELKGAHMEGELATFDQISFFDMATKDEEADVSLGEVSLIKPSPALSSAIGQALSGDEAAFDKIEGVVSFAGVNFVDMRVKAEDANIVFGKMTYGEAKDKTGTLLIENIDFDVKENAETVSMKLESFETTGINVQKYKGLFDEAMKEGASGHALGEEAMQKLLTSMNPYDPDFKTMTLKGMNMDVAGLVINLDSYDGKIEKKKGKLHSTLKMSPLTITPPAQSEDNDMKEFKEALSTMGYDKLSFTMGGTGILDEANDTMSSDNTFIEMQDGFKLTYVYDLKGYKTFYEQLMSAQTSVDSNPMAAMTALSVLKINSFELGLTDNSIIDRSFKLAAQKQGGTADALKQQAKAGLGLLGMMAQDEAQQKFATDLAKSVTALIDEGGTLSIKVNPEEDFNFGEMIMQSAGGQPDISKMNISISHK